MKTILISFLALAFCSFQAINTIYDYQINTADNNIYNMNDMRGKKCMIFLLPSTQTNEDSLWLLRIDSIFTANNGQLQMIGVPSREGGYISNETDTTIVSDKYRIMLDSSIIISNAMYTNKTSGESQAGLFQWLTRAELNGHIDNDTGGPCSMFFINEQGELSGAFGPEAKWSNKIINYMLPQ